MLCIMKKILFVYNSRLSYLPPFMSLLDYLIETGKYEITVISAEEEEISTYKAYADKIKIISYYKGRINNGLFDKLRIRLCQTLYFCYRLWKDIRHIPYDILWVIHTNSVIPIRSLLKRRTYIFSDYEWYDSDKLRYNASKFAQQHATVNVVCETNRAWFSKCKFGLKELPVVLPNKMWKRYTSDMLDPQLQNSVKRKKIILYQGIIHKQRPLDSLCEAISLMPDYSLLLLGNESDYSKSLLKKYSNILYHPFVTPPHHLSITKIAHIGIVFYDDNKSLNCAYCAPNKIWEYSMFSIPMLYNDIPGLNNTIGVYKAGEKIKLSDKESIMKAITKIDADYTSYRKSSEEFYNSCNISSIIDAILKKYEERCFSSKDSKTS